MRRMREMGIGKPVPRTEDLLLLRGLGRYTDDIALPRNFTSSTLYELP